MNMNAKPRRTSQEIASAAGYSVSRSDWVATGGVKGHSFVAYRPDGDRLPDDAATEIGAWRMASAEMRTKLGRQRSH